jgi:hypothetical protein
MVGNSDGAYRVALPHLPMRCACGTDWTATSLYRCMGGCPGKSHKRACKALLPLGERNPYVLVLLDATGRRCWIMLSNFYHK